MRWIWPFRRRPSPLDPLPDGRFIALDTETTGLDPRRDEPVAVAAVPFVDGAPAPEAGYASLVNPGRPIPAAARLVHGISDAMVSGAPLPEAVLDPLFAACRGAPVLVGFHVDFDLAILNRIARRARLPRLKAPALDIANLARGLSPHWAALALEELAERLGVPSEGRHTATGDAVIAGRIYVKLVPHLRARGIDTLPAALRFQSWSATEATRNRDGGFHGGPGSP